MRRGDDRHDRQDRNRETAGHGNAGRARTIDNDLNILDALIHQLERVEQTCTGDDRRPVLVVMKDGDIAAPLRLLLDVKAFRRFDVLEVNPTKGRRDHLHKAYDFFGVAAVDLNVKDINICKTFE